MRSRLFITALLLLLGAGLGARAAEGGISNDYTDAKFQLYKNNVFFCELRAKKARAENIGQGGAQTVKMEDGVVIDVFDTDAEVGDDAENPPLKLRITSEKGTYFQAKDGKTGAMQDMVIFHGTPAKPVRVERFRKSLPGRAPEIDAVITCDNEAKWNNTASILNGTGQVTMRKEDRTLNVAGVDMVYQLNEKSRGKVDLTEAEGQDLGGILEILKNVHMEILRKDRMGAVIPDSQVKIVSQGAARYDFDKREIVFKSAVNVTRNRMRMDSDFLKVVLADDGGEEERFKELIAWSDERGQVRINGKGNPNQAAGQTDTIGAWSAYGQYAQYKEESGELIITDKREGMLPQVCLDRHEIRNHEIRYFVGDQRLIAIGDRGEARLDGGTGDYDGKKSGTAQTAERTVITFKDTLFFEQKKRMAVFSKDVNLRSTGLVLDAQKLLVDFMDLDGVSREDAARRVKKITATDNVEVLYAERRAKCDKLEMVPAQERRVDARGRVLVDKFILSGERQPEIETPGNGYFQAKKITVYRYERASNGQKVVYVEAVGPGSGILGGKQSGLGRSALPGKGQDGTTINFKSHMVYDQMDDTVDFYGQVTADSGEQVLGTYRLIVKMLERLDVPAGAGDRKEISRLDAIGNAQERVTLHWQRHHCEAARVVREFSCGRKNVKDMILLEGGPQMPAKVWEENGAVFYGPKILTNPQGTTITSIGAGELTMLDRKTNEKAMVQYSGRADYIVSGDRSRAIFRNNVIMRRADMQVTSDVMQADLVKDTTVTETREAPELAGSSDVSSATLPRRLSRVIVQGNVIVRQNQRRAVGHKGQVDMAEEGDILRLEGGNGRLAEVDNHDGFKLMAPRMMVREGIGVITAAGPGQVDISSAAAGQSGAAAYEGLALSGAGGYKLTYGEQMVYNMPDGKITFSRDVVMTQEALHAKCQRLRILLDKSVQAAENNVKVDSVECEGDVYFNSFPGPITGIGDPFGMDGRTVRARSQHATYSARLKKIALSGSPMPQVLLQEKQPGQPPQRTFQSDQRIWIDTASGGVEMHGEERGKQTIQRWPAMLFSREERPWLP